MCARRREKPPARAGRRHPEARLHLPSFRRGPFKLTALRGPCPRISARQKELLNRVLAARLDQLEGDEGGARRWMARAAHAPGEADWSDIDEAGAAFNFTDADWRRMVHAWGREHQLIHPRHERFEIPAAAAPESALLEPPRAKPAAAAAAPQPEAPTAGDKPEPSFYEAGRAPDDPGVEDDDRK